MERIAWLGLGSMGRRMAQRLITGGHEVTVWTRSGAVHPLRAHARTTAREAVRGADVVFAMLADDDASREVWLDRETGALAAMASGAIVVESSTLSPTFTRELAARAAEHGCGFVDAPVVGSRPQAEAGSLVHLVGGEPADVTRIRPLLAALGSAVHVLGASPNGMRAKLVVNALFAAQIALLGELLGTAGLGGLDPLALMEVLGTLPVTSAAAKLAGAAMCASRFDPLFPVALAAKDLRYAVAAAKALGAELPVTERVAEVFARADHAGLSADNLTAVAKLYRAPAAATPDPSLTTTTRKS